MTFKEKVINVVKKIPFGKFLTYKEVAKRAGNVKALRSVGNILFQNRKLANFPCHRVIRSDFLVGGYLGKNNLDWLKASLLLKEGAIGVIPTDTIYGICTSAFNEKSVIKVYKLRKRSPKKPCIILISSMNDLKFFKIKLNERQKKILKKIWPAKISVILPCPYKEFLYLHRNLKTLAFRLPKDRLILNILKISRPLIAPSANWEDYEPAKNIKEAKKYFGDKVFYLDRGNLIAQPSTLIDLTKKELKIVREGEDIEKVKRIMR